MTVDDLVATREDMDRQRFEEEMAGVDGPRVREMVAEIHGQQSIHHDMPADLRAALSTDEISRLLVGRAERAFQAGDAAGWNRAWQQAHATTEAEVRAESQRWVEVALELVVRELGPVFEAAVAAQERAARAKKVAGRPRVGEREAAAVEALEAAAEATSAVDGLRERLAELGKAIARDGISS